MSSAVVAIATVIQSRPSEDPSIVGFRWSETQLWGSTWPLLFSAISASVSLSLAIHIFLCLVRSRRPVPLSPLPAVHSLSMALISATIFNGILLSAAAEIRETRWFWRRFKTPFKWLVCFPLGTRPSGFWSYIFHLSRFIHLLRTFFTILQRRKLASFQPYNNSILIFMSFLWLQFSQSFQVLGIIFTTMVSSVVYWYRFWTAVGLPNACFPFLLNCQIVLSGCDLVSHIGVLAVHFMNCRCNGVGAWWFNSVLNAVILVLFLNFYTKSHLRKGGLNGGAAEDHSGFPASVIDDSKQGRLFSRGTKKFRKHVKNSAMKSGGRTIN